MLPQRITLADDDPTFEDRFWAKVEIDPATSCWIWLAAVGANGYGRVLLGGKTVVAHRAAYAFFKERFDPRLDLDHLCRNRACVNPEHLEPVTRAENLRRGMNGELKTHCAQGHPFIPENRLKNGNGKTRCRLCLNEYQRRTRSVKSSSQN